MNAALKTVLIVDDERAIRKFLRTFLETQGYRTPEATTGREALALAALASPDVILLDLGLPDMDGLTVLERLREWSEVPVIVLSARGQEADKVAALDAGAVDYLTKPFGVEELSARIRVALRQARRGEEPELSVIDGKDLRIDITAHRVWTEGKEVRLTPLEFKLLATLARHAGKVVTQRQLLSEVWGQSSNEQGHYVRIYVHQLRRKIEPDPARPRYLRTEPGIGYRFVLDETDV